MVFVYDELLFVVMELDDEEALSLVPVITSTLLDEHSVVAHVVAFVSPGTLPINRDGEKQRARLCKSFVSGEIAPRQLIVNRRM
jgi:hypothetical protein